MSENLPLHLDQGTSVKVHRRAALANERELKQAQFAHSGEFPDVMIAREYAWGCLRWAQRMLDETLGIPLAEDAPQLSAEEWSALALAKGTSPGTDGVP